MGLSLAGVANRRMEAAVIFTILALAAASRAQIAASPQPTLCAQSGAHHPASKSDQGVSLPRWVLALIPPPPRA
ncbi:MAG TPA: hypothetical protein VGL66_11825 [Caulobacteraceae bacterium]|jgi:hypothetical protein